MLLHVKLGKFTGLEPPAAKSRTHQSNMHGSARVRLDAHETKPDPANCTQPKQQWLCLTSSNCSGLVLSEAFFLSTKYLLVDGE